MSNENIETLRALRDALASAAKHAADVRPNSMDPWLSRMFPWSAGEDLARWQKSVEDMVRALEEVTVPIAIDDEVRVIDLNRTRSAPRFEKYKLIDVRRKHLSLARIYEDRSVAERTESFDIEFGRCATSGCRIVDTDLARIHRFIVAPREAELAARR